MARRFRGESHHKVDAKGRVSIPASFRRVLESGDPNWESGEAPTLVIVYGGHTRNYLECFTINAMDEVEDRILKMGRGDKRRLALSRLYLQQSLETNVDGTGRLVLPKELRDKIGLDGTAFFAGKGDTFEVWNPETYEENFAAQLEPDDDFDPDLDPAVYLDGLGG
ncbi:division/cell wall cluster transcriptional repressor MraZ [Shimia thalassica]|uniref:division/cell wall cluster transcriptional repressor MraZ n=1 Tax=Shimia thalassica TaxID=1715693 RepID=UPI002495A82B|nr:division/cell wall cluster transcriptional repressor MraZ [Shimia thalassica]MDO6482523.1 division/cell wall cluster transcriptional repressor MraZ [Shimia thalassica]MDO6520132.1 division/cell wall cluster transcriptional repressor MraZ [Shimia thalassica]MDO6797286.1 division/cell wall cluster transcriptional repressor MraZ [Shimia thalassica]